MVDIPTDPTKLRGVVPPPARSSVNTTQLDKANEVLEQIIEYIDLYASKLNNAPQKTVDAAMTKLGIVLANKLNPIQQNMVNAYQPQVSDATRSVALLKDLVNANIADLPSVISQVTGLTKIVCGPYYPAVAYLEAIVPKLTLFVSNLETLMSYQPKLPNPNVTANLNIPMAPLSISDFIN